MSTEHAGRSPRVGVGVIIRRDDQVLLGERLGSHGAGSWSFPGGHLEFGEGPEDCARREVEEESSLIVGRLVSAGYTNDIFDHSGHLATDASVVARHYITLFFETSDFRGTPVVREPDKCARWQWYPWNRLPEPLFLPIQNLLARGWRPR